MLMSSDWSRTTIDQLGERLRRGPSTEDLRLLDDYRRGFREDFEKLVSEIRERTSLEPSGRPAKSTVAILEKLRRSTARFSQIQDIAGCRIVLEDIESQDRVIVDLASWYPSKVVDRRAKPSFGYRAVHVIVRPSTRPIEIQVRTHLQHLWAEMSEKIADRYGQGLKYGEGPESWRAILISYSGLISLFEKFERRKHLSNSTKAVLDQVRERLTLALREVTEHSGSRKQ